MNRLFLVCNGIGLDGSGFYGIQKIIQQGSPLHGQVYYLAIDSLLCSLRKCVSTAGTFSGTLGCCFFLPGGTRDSFSFWAVGQGNCPSPKQGTTKELRAK